MRLKVDQADHVRATAKRLLDERFAGNESALARALKLSQSTVSRFLAGQIGSSLSTVEKVAELAGVSVASLLGVAPPAMSEASAPSPAPPPVSETRVASDAIDDLLDLSFDPRLHHPSDVRPVIDALLSHATLLRGSTEAGDIVRALLDTVAEARAKGRKLTAEELPAAALGSTKRRLIFAEAKIAQLMAQAVAEAEALELEPRDTPHPDLVAAQRRAGLGEAGTSGPRRGG